MKYINFCLLVLIINSFLGCQKKELILPPSTKNILHMAHTRTGTEGEISDEIKDINFQAFDVLCLGGDLDIYTSREESTLQTWNNLFNFERPNTLWTLGNHDISDKPLIEKYTKRPSYYTWAFEQIQFLVLDDHLNNGDIVGDQLQLIQNLADTMQNSQHLIVLTHKLLWMPGHPELDRQVEDIANGPRGNCGSCTREGNFYDEVYPLLVALKNKNINVVCIAGDIGIKAKEFEYITDEGIHLLASGIDIGQAGNKVLLLELQQNGSILNWCFENLETLKSY